MYEFNDIGWISVLAFGLPFVSFVLLYMIMGKNHGKKHGNLHASNK